MVAIVVLFQTVDLGKADFFKAQVERFEQKKCRGLIKNTFNN